MNEQISGKCVIYCHGSTEPVKDFGFRCALAFSVKTTDGYYVATKAMMLPSELVKPGKNPMASAEYHGSRRADFKAFELAMKEALIMIDIGYTDVEIISTSSYIVNTVKGSITCVDRQVEFMNFSDLVRKKKIKLTLAKGEDSDVVEMVELGDRIANTMPQPFKGNYVE